MAVSRRIELFGGLRIIDETPITHFYSQKTAALLAYLAYYRDRAHPRDVLIEMLWPWASPPAGRHSLSQALSSLRHQLEPHPIAPGAVLLADRNTVGLNPATTSTDVAEFESALAEAAKAETLVRTRLLEEAVALYRGEFLAGFYEPWIAAVAERLVENYVGAVEALAEILVERGDPGAAVSRLERAIEAAPFREEPYRGLMRLHVAMGDPRAALETYEDLEAVLGKEKGEKPSLATQELAREMERLVAAQPATVATRSRTVHRPPVRRPGATLPTGTVTFLAIQAVDEPPGTASDTSLFQEEISRHGGMRVEAGGGSQVIAFSRVADALGCAAACQLRVAKQFHAEGSQTTRPAVVAHSTDVEHHTDGTYPRAVVERVLRLLAAANPAQVLCSETTAGLVRYNLDGGLRLRELGSYRLRGTANPERFYQLDYPGGPEAVAPLDAQLGHMSHLPLRLTRFIGRQHEIERLVALLTGESRLVTLVGGPGCGKTRLAIETGNQMLEEFAGLVWFVPLADLRGGGDILDRALDPLGIQRQPQAKPLDQIAAVLAEQPVLIVFDNFEHLIESAGEVRALLERLPALRCLVTSRRRLGLAGEREFPVIPFPLPDGASLAQLLSNDSAQLFVDRAQAVKPDFQLTPDNVETVAELCRRLEGVPLAIEIAAARSQSHGLKQMLERIGKGETLLTRSRDAADRHRSLAAAVEWSYELLSPELRQFFAKLSVFRGGWTAEAAEAVCEEPMASDHLARLVDCSLIHPEPGIRQGTRFQMLDMVRDYAAERLRALGQEEATRRKHLAYFLGLAESTEPKLVGAEQGAWLERLSTDLDNFIHAANSCDVVTVDADCSLRLLGSLWRVWWILGYHTLGRSVLDKALSRAPYASPTRGRAKALYAAGYLALFQGEADRAEVLLSHALRIFRELDDDHGAAMTLHALGNVAKRRDPEEGRSLLNESQELFRKTGDRHGEGMTNYSLGHIARSDGDLSTAAELYALAREMLRGDPTYESGVLGCLGKLAIKRGKLDEAEKLLTDALTLSRSLGFRSKEGDMLVTLGGLASTRHDLRRAALAYREAIDVHLRLGRTYEAMQIALYLHNTYCATGDLESARATLIESLELAQRTGDRHQGSHGLQATAVLVCKDCPSETRMTRMLAAVRFLAQASAVPEAVHCESAGAEMEKHKAVLRDSLGRKAFTAAWTKSLAMPFEQVIQEALETLHALAPRSKSTSALG